MMEKRIYRSLYFTALLALLLSTLASLLLYFNFYDRREDEHLMTQAEALALGLSELQGQDMASVNAYLMNYQKAVAAEGDLKVRITLVQAKDGAVLYDSDKKSSEMESHSDRKEIVEAEQNGRGSDVRVSRTLGKNTHYAAVRTEDGRCILRLSRETSSLTGLFFRILPALVLVMAVLFLLVMYVSKRVTRQIVAPLDKVAEEIRRMDTPTVRTEDSEVYEELKPFVDSVKESQQVREEFSANVSHELRTPLTSISGYAEMLKDGMVGDNAHVREFAGTIYAESQRMLALIDDIMHLSRIEEGKDMIWEQLSLRAVSDEIIKRLSDKAAKYQVSVHLSGPAAEITGNRTMLEEMIYNLVDNAIKYNHSGGHVYVITKAGEQNAIIVQDDGIGIPVKDQNRVWERFYRVDKSHSRAIGGTGLGLSIVKHVAEKHGAVVDLSSELGKGTRIMVTFP